MARHLIPHEVVHLLVPPEDGAQHLAAEIIVRQPRVVSRKWSLVWHIVETALGKLEKIHHFVFFRAPRDFMA